MSPYVEQAAIRAGIIIKIPPTNEYVGPWAGRYGVPLKRRLGLFELVVSIIRQLKSS